MPSRSSSRPARPGHARRFAAVLVLALAASTVGVVDARAAAATVTSLTSEGFTGATTADASWNLPPAVSPRVNAACLTAGTDTRQTPIPGCTPKVTEAGPGTLRLTRNTTSAVGTVYSTTSLPTTQGLDVRFNTYQWSSHTNPGADGISFVLAATDPTNPAPPATTGPVGGSLGYSATAARGTSPSAPGVTNGYLGFGLDVYGNYRSSQFGGSGCPTSTAAQQNVTVRGPGNANSGYCIAGTQQVTVGALDARTGTSRPAPVPVEVALNPASTATTSLGGVPIPGRSWLMAFTPVGGAQQTMTGDLPTAAALASFGFPASYYDPATGLPYQLTFGWAASTGGSDEIHEVNNLASSTLNGALPDLDLTVDDSQGAAFLAGSDATVSVTPSLDASQGPENRPATVTTTFPAGLTPGNPSTTDYLCSTTGQVVSCTYTTVPVAAGTALPTLRIPVRVGAAAATGLTITVKASSTDANPAQATRAVSVVGFGARATPARVPYGTAATLTATGLPAAATGTVVFTTGGSTLCTATLPEVSCPAPATLAPGTYPVTATYGGDAAYASRTAGTSLVVTRAAPVLSASVSAAETTYGTSDTLSFSGLPAGATGSVIFTSGGTTLCTVDDVTAATGCPTADGLDVGSYAVTATYSGDAGFSAATASTTFSVVKAPVDLQAAVSRPTVPYGTGDTLSVGGLPADATGTVRFTAADGSVLCVIDDVALASSCEVPATTATGAYDVTAAYAGDRHHRPAEAGTGFEIVKAETTLVAAVSDPSVPFGTSSALTSSGLPADATGTVTFAAGSETLCSVDVAEASSCLSPTDLESGDHVVTATYAGDRNHLGSQDRTRLVVTAKGSPSFTATASDPAPTFGTPDTLAFSGLAAGATGAVTFRAGGRTLCEVEDVTTASSCTTADDLDAGGYDVTARYSGDRNHAAASADASFRVDPADTALSAAVADDTLTYGLAQTLSFGGLPEAATGSVTFTAGGRTLCVVVDVQEAGSCESEDVLGAGTYAVTARYSGDGNHRGSSGTTSFTVERADVDLAAGVSDAEVPYGTAATLSFSGVPAGAGGTVTFTSGSAVLCVVDDVRTAGGCVVAADLPVGTYPVTASYSGDADHRSAEATTTFAVVRAPSALSASVGRATVPWGTGETLAFGGLPTGATGSVTFTVGDVVLCTVDDVTVTSTCESGTDLATGDYRVTATYSGDDRFVGSQATTRFTVVRAVPSLNASALSGAVTFGSASTLTFSSLPPDATGSVTFSAGTRTLCTVEDVTVTDRCETSASLPVGTYPVVATYSGDDRFAGVTAATGFVVTPAATALRVGVRAPQVERGESQLLSVAGLPAGATGSVTFTSGGRTLCTVADVTAVTSCATGTDLPVGTYPVVGVYSGDANHQPAEATTTFDVVRIGIEGFTAAVDPARTPYGTPVTLSFAGLPDGATGTVDFVAEGPVDARAPGRPLCSVEVGDGDRCRTPASLEPGSYAVLATYSGDATHAPASAPLTFDVEEPDAADPGSGDGDGSGDGSGNGSGGGSADGSDDAGSASHDGALASTGGPGAGPLVGGLLLLVGGSGALVVARRRRG